MREVGVLEAKTNLSALLDAVEREGEEIVITRHGKPVARLTAAPSRGGRIRRLTGEQLVARFKESHELQRRENPEIEKLTWEEILAMRDP
jgi:prevent-host-death family protein